MLLLSGCFDRMDAFAVQNLPRSTTIEQYELQNESPSNPVALLLDRLGGLLLLLVSLQAASS